MPRASPGVTISAATEDPGEDLAVALAGLLNDLRPASEFHLRTALLAALTEGVGGQLVITLPRRGKDPVDVAFIGGTARLTLET